MSLGKRINELRAQENISQEILAVELGVSRQTISKWETDQSMPEIDKIQLLSHYFNVSIDYLLEGTESAQLNKFIRPDRKVSCFKQLSLIALKSSFIIAIVNIVVLITLIFRQNVLIKLFKITGYQDMQFVVPVQLTVVTLVTCLAIIVFSKLSIDKFKIENKSIVSEVLFLIFLILVIPFVLLIFNEIYSLILNVKILNSEGSYLKQYAYSQHLEVIINRMMWGFRINTFLVTFGLITSLIMRKLDPTPYHENLPSKDEEVASWKKVVALLISFFGGLIIWVIGLVTYNLTRKTHPKHYQETRFLFVLGLIISIPANIIFLWILIII